MSFSEHCLHLQAAKAASGLTFADIATKLDKPEVWTAALFYGSAVTDESTAGSIFSILESSSGFMSQGEKSGKFTKESLINGLAGKGPSSLGVDGMIVRGQNWECPPKVGCCDVIVLMDRTPCCIDYTRF